jgi:hypothetical protein
MTRKADSVQVTQCTCGRITFVLLDGDDEVIASAELDPQQWLDVCREIIARNQSLLDNPVEFVSHEPN